MTNLGLCFEGLLSVSVGFAFRQPKAAHMVNAQASALIVVSTPCLARRTETACSPLSPSWSRYQRKSESGEHPPSNLRVPLTPLQADGHAHDQYK